MCLPSTATTQFTCTNNNLLILVNRKQIDFVRELILELNNLIAIQTEYIYVQKNCFKNNISNIYNKYNKFIT